MSGLNPDDGLINLVGSIDDERPVDWDAAEREAQSEQDRATIRELKLLSEIARVYRDPDSAITAPPPPRHAPEHHVPARTWGQLRVLNEIGRGAFSTIYRALDAFDREVALKVLSLGPHSGDVDRARIIREGRLLARLEHRNIVSVYGADEVDGEVGLWMQLIRGTTLEDELTARGPRGEREATIIGLDICRALAAMHSAGLLHRDVKAQNVMRELGGRNVLMDLGAGLDLARDAAVRSRTMAGTPLYLAPELFSKGTPSVASDIYSLGVLLYRIASGAFPVEGRTLDDIARAHERGERKLLRDARADLPDGFVRVVERALAPQPEQRYRSAGEFEEALAALLPRADVAPRPTPTARWWAMAAAAVTIGVAAVWAIVSTMPSADRPLRLQAGESSAPKPPSVAAASVPYKVEAAFHKVTNRETTTLSKDARVAPGDALMLTVKTSRPAYIYVYNEDAVGEAYLLYPLPGQESKALAADVVHRLPEQQAGQPVYWVISSAGKREHFVVLVNTEPEPVLEATLRRLPAPDFNRRASSARIPDNLIGTLRGVGGLSTGPAPATGDGPRMFSSARPLGTEPETVTGLWVRRLTLANP